MDYSVCPECGNLVTPYTMVKIGEACYKSKCVECGIVTFYEDCGDVLLPRASMVPPELKEKYDNRPRDERVFMLKTDGGTIYQVPYDDAMDVTCISGMLAIGQSVTLKDGRQVRRLMNIKPKKKCSNIQLLEKLTRKI